MKSDRYRDTTLHVYASESLVGVVTSFAEKTAQAFGLGNGDALKLMLAAEEIFAHLCRAAPTAGNRVAIRCVNGGYHVQLDFSFPAQEINMRAFNLTASVCPDDEACMEEVGLLLASRSVDRLRVERVDMHTMKLSVTKEKSYPVGEGEAPATCAIQSPDFVVREPSPEELKLLSRCTLSLYGKQLLPDFLRYPGKLVDMVGCGEYRALIAAGPKGDLGGGIVWHRLGPRTVECFGPYIFGHTVKSEASRSLVEGCIVAIARTRAVGLINRYPTPEFPRDQFEHLGDMRVITGSGSTELESGWFRLMHEDPGCVVWAHGDLHDFLRCEYDRLVLPRRIRLVKDAGEARSTHSVLAADFDRPRGRVVLRPIWPGTDMEENLRNHLKLLEDEQVPNVLFILDLAQSWHAYFAPVLLSQGFKPRMVLPYACEADSVMFQLEDARS